VGCDPTSSIATSTQSRPGHKKVPPPDHSTGAPLVPSDTWGHQANLPITLTTVGRNSLRKKLIRTCKNNDKDGGKEETADDVSENDDDDSISNMNAASETKKYVRKESRWIDFSQCQNDCCVFVGKLTKCFLCPKCNTSRFRPCSRNQCTGKGKDNCEHLLTDGIAYKSLHYRLLIPLITDLVNTKHFVAALHYRNKFQYSGYEDFYADILDGSIAKEHLDSTTRLGVLRSRLIPSQHQLTYY
jgi:hypothetical protein